MSPRLSDEIKQTKPFTSLEHEAVLSLERTVAVLSHAFGELLKPYGVTPTQYNVLRILRGAGSGGLCRHEVRDRMIAQVPDVTRLLDRLEEMGLVERQRDSEDRRLVTARITREGLRVLDQLDDPVAESHRRQLAHLTQAELRTLIELLGKARQSA